VRLVKGARSVDSEWKSRSGSSIKKSRRNRRGLEKLEKNEGRAGGSRAFELGDPRNYGAAAMQMQVRVCLQGERASFRAPPALRSTALLTLTANLSMGKQAEAEVGRGRGQ
jgi:hypothetical protein